MDSLFVGSWRITEMELWEQVDIDLEVPGFFSFDAEGMGEFQFILVRGCLDCRYGSREGRPLVEFTWEGQDEGDDVLGRGFAEIEPNGTLCGRIFRHRGDDSEFRAVRMTKATPPRRQTRPRKPKR